MFLRSLIVWLVIMVSEIIHGTARRFLLEPVIGDFTARQISVFTGSLMILALSIVFIRWIGAARTPLLIGVGIFWVALTVTFEILFGRFVAGETWERLASDYNLPEGGLMPVGLLVMAASPFIAAKLRGVGRES